MDPVDQSAAAGGMILDLLVRRIKDYAIFMLDPSGIIVSWNDGAKRIKGYDAEEVVGKHFSIFYTEEERQSGEPDEVLRVARETGRFEAERQRVRKDGTVFWADIVMEPIRDENGDLLGFAKVTRDISERRAAEKERDELRAQASQSQRLEAVGQLTGGVAHDFNNLLTVISGSLDLMEPEIIAPKVRHYHAIIKRAAERGATLVSKLLVFARRHVMRPEVVNAAQAIESTLSLLRYAIREDVHVFVDAPKELDRIKVDSTQLELAILNLALNAGDAMPNGGDLHICSHNQRCDESDGVKPGDYVIIRVKDNGCGIPEDIIDRVVEPFFSTKGVGSGSGLGLSQVYGFALQSGGNLKITSTVGVGTEVRLILPSAGQISPPPEAPPLPQRKRILVVEDDHDLREIVCDTLELDYEVTAAASCDDAKLEMENRDFDLLFSDIVMPGSMNGIQLAREVKETRPGMPVLLCSGYSEALSNVENSDLPFLAKPYRISHLLEVIERMLKPTS